MELLKRIRPVNLLIILMTQCFFYFIILKEVFQDSGQLYGVFIFSLISIITLIIAGSGFIINDVMDVHIDSINHPEHSPIDKSLYIRHYVKIVLFGMLLNILLAYLGGLWRYVWIYPLACFLLFLYSSDLKCRGLIGNIVVALFSAFVVAILLVPLIPQVNSLTQLQADVLLNNFSYYFILGFLISIIREIVKDIEDVNGDRSLGCNTIAVALGVNRAKVYVVFFMIILLFTLSLWIFATQDFYKLWHRIYLILLVIGPLVFLIVKTIRAKEKEAYHRISTHLKSIMILGILFLLISQF